jgi:hypothetical protein
MPAISESFVPTPQGLRHQIERNPFAQSFAEMPSLEAASQAVPPIMNVITPAMSALLDQIEASTPSSEEVKSSSSSPAVRGKGRRAKRQAHEAGDELNSKERRKKLNCEASAR